MKTVAIVQFTGNAKTYEYVAVPQRDADAIKQGAAGGQGICRVVVPGKIKEDGTLSLSIATVVSTREVSDEEAYLLYPVVIAIPPNVLDYAKAAVSMIDATKAALAQGT